MTGAPGGFSTFYAGGATSGYNFVDQGGNNTFIGGTGPDNFTANGNTNDFKAGTGAGSFTDPGSGNIVDFSAQPAMVTLNVSGQQVQLTPPNAATVGTSTQVTTLYTFSASACHLYRIPRRYDLRGGWDRRHLRRVFQHHDQHPEFRLLHPDHRRPAPGLCGGRYRVHGTGGGPARHGG